MLTLDNRTEVVPVDVLIVSQVIERAGWAHADALCTDAEDFDAVIIRSVLTVTCDTGGYRLPRSF
jgi:hypothetical protein